MKNKHKLEDIFNKKMGIIRDLEVLYNKIVKGVSIIKIKKEIKDIISRNL